MAQLDFEDMSGWEEWPVHLSALRDAASAAWQTWSNLDDLVEMTYELGEDKSPVKRGPLHELAGRAYALLCDLRAEGMRQLAEWEAQPATPATAGVFACADCGDGTFAGIEGLNLPQCPNCGRSDEVYQIAGGIPVDEDVHSSEKQQEENDQESRRRQQANWNAVADGMAPPYPSEY